MPKKLVWDGPTRRVVDLTEEEVFASLSPLEQERQLMVVSAFQAKGALMLAGLYTAAEQASTSIGGITLLAWQTAIEYRRDSRSIETIQAMLGLTDEQVDELFRVAKEIDA